LNGRNSSKIQAAGAKSLFVGSGHLMTRFFLPTTQLLVPHYLLWNQSHINKHSQCLKRPCLTMLSDNSKSKSEAEWVQIVTAHEQAVKDWVAECEKL